MEIPTDGVARPPVTPQPVPISTPSSTNSMPATTAASKINSELPSSDATIATTTYAAATPDNPIPKGSSLGQKQFSFHKIIK